MAYPTKDQIREREALAKFKLKRCGRCRGIKPRVNFSKASKASKAWDGLQSHCKECLRRYREANKEAIKKQSRQYHADNREAIAERRRQYYEANRESCNEMMRQYRQTPEGRAATRKGNRKRRALKRSVRENFTAEDERFVLERDGHKCVDCGITNQEHIAQFGQRLHIDHVLPLSKGHALTRENAAVRCRSCNSRKSNK